MDEDKKTSTPDERRGSVKEAIGKVTGNRRAEVEGAAEKEAARSNKQDDGSRR
jgi:uncharacterized protein YjbJ (UPF0337 family)